MKTRKLLLSLLILTPLFFLGSCDNNCKHTDCSWLVDVEPTCNDEGHRNWVCNKCGETLREETLPVSNHSAGDWIIDKEPTCKESGSKHLVCSICGETITEESISSSEHQYGNWIIDKEPTCTDSGSKHCVCSICEKVTSETIAAIGHKYVDEIVPATMSDNGYTKHTCSICGDSYRDSLIDIKLKYVDNDNGTCTITGIGSFQDKNLIIPSKINGLDVVKIASNAFKNCSFLESVAIPDSVLYIGKGALEGCSSLVKISIPFVGYEEHEASDIYQYPFGYIFGQSPYTDSYRARQYYFDDSITDTTWEYFYIPLTLKEVVISNTKHIPYGAFYNCTINTITLPDSVTSIGDNAFYNCPIEKATIPAVACSYLNNSKLKEVVISSGEIIDEKAFDGCVSLDSIAISETIKSIEKWAFRNCSSLKSFKIPANVSSICNDAFAKCSSLESINVDNNNIYYDSRDNCNAIIDSTTNTLIVGCKNTIILDSVTSIGEGAFSGCSSITSIVIPDSVTKIGCGALSGCSSLVKITLPFVGNKEYTSSDSYEYPFGYIFGHDSYVDSYRVEQCYYYSSHFIYYCDYYIPLSLKEVILTNTEYIPYEAFSNCASLTSITIPNCVSSIGENAFKNCPSLVTLIVGNNNMYYDSRDNCNAVIESSSNTLVVGCKNTIIPESVTSIGYKAFNNCTSLTSITIPNTVVSIDNQAFYDCPIKKANIPTIAIPGIINNELKEVNITSGKTIERDAFYNCSSLTSIIISDSVTSIGSNAFENCSSLASITIPESVATIGESAFKNCSYLETITIPAGVKSIGDYAFYNCKSLKSITIPDSVTSVGYYAFSGCTSLTSITIPDSVTSIGSNAFRYCSIEKATIPAIACSYIKNSNLKEVVITSGTLIGIDAFSGCTSLESITIPDSVTSIGSNAFRYCSIEKATIPSIVCSYIKNSKLKEVVITSGTSIGIDAFSGCTSLESITIPDSVTSIGSNAFYNCTSLDTIYYEGTSEQYSLLSNTPSYATVYYYSEEYKSGNYWHYVDNVPTKWTN